jgi:carboxymethylenebutenolidase
MSEIPPRQTAKDFDPEVLKLFDRYVHGLSSRRDFLDAAARFVVEGTTAEALLEALSPRFAEGQQVAPNDPRIKTATVDFPSPEGYGTVRGLLVRPAEQAGPLPTVLVAHENRGLNPDIEDIARRLGTHGFIAFAPDALYPLGGYPGDEDTARERFKGLDRDRTRNDFVAAANALKTLPDGNGKVGVVGFCYGGGIANFLATKLPDLAAAVSFYGSQPAAEDVKRIKAPLLIHYAELDERINAGWPVFQAALQAAGIDHQAYVYPGVQHGFNNDTTPRYDPAAASLAWERTIAFLHERLRG